MALNTIEVGTTLPVLDENNAELPAAEYTVTIGAGSEAALSAESSSGNWTVTGLAAAGRAQIDAVQTATSETATVIVAVTQAFEIHIGS